MFESVSPFYCSPVDAELEEIARLSLQRHGQSTYASAGLGAKKSYFIRRQLARMIENDTVNLHPELTVSDLAGQIGCTVDQFLHVISRENKRHVGSIDDLDKVGELNKLVPGKSADSESSD